MSCQPIIRPLLLLNKNRIFYRGQKNYLAVLANNLNIFLPAAGRPATGLQLTSVVFVVALIHALYIALAYNATCMIYIFLK